MISETLAQYSALMVMEREYGKEKMRRFLKHELDEYLSNRGNELVEEMPLYLVENQPYIHYRKGSLVMYALRDAIGEAPLEKRHVTSPEMSFELVVDERPVRTGIDPYSKLVDRDSDDNVRRVAKGSVSSIPGAASGR